MTSRLAKVWRLQCHVYPPSRLPSFPAPFIAAWVHSTALGRIGLVNRLLIIALRSVITMLGYPSIRSEITIDEQAGRAGISRNTYKLVKWAIPLCVFRDVYELDPDGERVAVTTDIHYGPIPGILTEHVEYTARIFDGGFRSRYEGLRLLGMDWVAQHQVAADKNHVEGSPVCEWAEARERMRRRSGRR